MVTINIHNCKFQANHASEFGGGAYTILDGVSNHVISFDSSTFIDDLSENHAGGLEIGFSRNGNESHSNRVLVCDSCFIGNQAVYGGGMYFFYIGEEEGRGGEGRGGEGEGRGKGREGGGNGGRDATIKCG